MAGWKAGEKGDVARGRGIGFSKYKNLACYCAVIADVEVDRASGRVRVTRAWSAADAGLIINPDGLIQQIEGGIIQSASWTLHEEVKFDTNGILSRDWSNYPILTMPEVAEGRGRADQPSGRTLARRRRRLARPGGRGDRQCVRARDRQARARPAVPSGAREGRAGMSLKERGA